MNAEEFLSKYGLAPEAIDPSREAETMLEHMKSGLSGNIVDMPMIPTYIFADGEIEKGRNIIVIDAGGTNYRRALACFTDSGCEVTELEVSKMPGTGDPVTWDEFISFVADSVSPLTDRADVIGFCFSYNVDITPEIDGIVHRIDKEVVVTGSNGKLIGASLTAELERRGICGKRVIILNDTVAALLGGMARIDRARYDGLAGMICGTGVNTCCALPVGKIGKLSGVKEGSMLINLESGMFNGMPMGSVDYEVDLASNNSGEKIMEKMSSGVYLGTICRTALARAAEEGCISSGALERAENMKKLDGSVVDMWSCFRDEYGVFETPEEMEFAGRLCLALFERSARCMCTNIIALMLLMEKGRDAERPVCVCAEGSLIERSTHFKSMLESLLGEYAAGRLGLHCELALGRETTLPGSAVAALLNS